MTIARITFVRPDGSAKMVEADQEGESLMSLATRSGIDEIVGECGGNLSCATCHAYIDRAWLDRIPPAEEFEQVMLEGALDPEENSRLTCQVKVTPELDGLIVHLPPTQY